MCIRDRIVATADSVVRSVEATDVAFCNALLVTFTGSRISLPFSEFVSVTCSFIISLSLSLIHI